jgi:choice-of-anchor A domain-containing protein
MPDVGGSGTLIVMGNLTISGNNLWKGILLVGGTMTSNGNGTMTGATMSGLNTMFKQPPEVPVDELALAQAKVPAGTTLTRTPANATANGTKTFQYDSCEVARAAGGLASYSVYPNAWMDNFVTY